MTRIMQANLNRSRLANNLLNELRLISEQYQYIAGPTWDPDSSGTTAIWLANTGKFQVAYATMIVSRIEKCDNVVDLYLIAAKARVAPIKKITIPRLELLGAVIGARMAQGILSEFEKIPIYYWSNSMTVLA